MGRRKADTCGGGRGSPSPPVNPHTPLTPPSMDSSTTVFFVCITLCWSQSGVEPAHFPPSPLPTTPQAKCPLIGTLRPCGTALRYTLHITSGGELPPNFLGLAMVAYGAPAGAGQGVDAMGCSDHHIGQCNSA
mmetsp:Transcript_32680/g.53312  ORF Transcript_32680/g.53312 Transcript_32680/m.53312 type:complete len:133 (+) Transcript_32680:494-892(+)